MPIICGDIAAVGDALLTSAAGEPALRSAASRHYYSAMHRCDEWKNALPGAPSVAGHPGGSHQQLLNQLRNLDPKCTPAQKLKGRILAAKLGALKVTRVLADYQLQDTLTAAEATQQQTDAYALIADCAKP
jgi:hypothetical protein